VGGTDNLAGVDFQITYCVHTIINMLKNNENFSYIQFEGLDDEGQDVQIIRSDLTTELIQIKKRGEGYPWTYSSIKPIIEKFFKDYKDINTYIFFTDGSLNTDLIDFRDNIGNLAYLLEHRSHLSSLLPPGASASDFIKFISRFRLLTRQFVSSDPKDPALNIRNDCKETLGNFPFVPFLDVNVIFQNLWNLVFETSKVNGRLSYDEVKRYVRTFGLIRDLSGRPLWSADEQHRTKEVNEILSQHSQYRFLFIYGLNGTGKSTTVAQSLREQYESGKLLWITTSPSSDDKYIRGTIAVFLESTGHSESVREHHV
jgi:hypothetical protein